MSLSYVNLTSGRTVDLTEVRLSSTYGGFLEGYPCRRINDMSVSGLERGAKAAHPHSPVHLVAPAREYPEGDAAPGPFGPVEVLPAVRCVGVFTSNPVDPDLDPVLHRSGLVVAWYQADPDVPSGDRADQGLRDVPWDELAEDFEL
ncbi:hypothetical protein [Streptomyces sp. NPDC020917]|uniref:hypothetical protein n=1 Tax=Streptomyces sp. NPDC020917 TaxID=3365102 RepID=UPI0037AA54CF